VPRYSRLLDRRLSVREAATERLASSRAGAWLFVHAFHHIDKRLLPSTRGRLSVAVGAPVGMLESTGARSGQKRHTPLLYAADGDRLVLVASNGGAARHPAWFHNVRAHPDVHFLTRDGAQRAYRASVAGGAERARLWELAADLYAGYPAYQARIPAREIPVVVLEPLTRAP
jgi:deazaflavin-dependent oxidoreductase (nitroreductase family)